jgi:hypothetical protein
VSATSFVNVILSPSAVIGTSTSNEKVKSTKPETSSEVVSQGWPAAVLFPVILHSALSVRAQFSVGVGATTGVAIGEGIGASVS